jgi:His/Glu/Gln/Arg/opine family amino acid ABC transporter permease subunit
LDFALMWRTLPFFAEAAMVTLGLTTASVFLGTIIGLMVALCRLSRNPILRGFGFFYVTVIRGTPLLVQLFLLYYGLPQVGISLSPFAAGIVGLSCNTGGYIAEILRGGIQGVDSGQMEAALSVGLNYAQAMRKVILPQAFRIVVPPLANEFIIMLKSSSLVAAISLTELTRLAWRMKQGTYKPLEMYTLALVFYVVMSTVLYLASEAIQRRMGMKDDVTRTTTGLKKRVAGSLSRAPGGGG